MGNIGGIAGHMAAGYIENCRAYGLFLANPESYDEGNLVNSSMLCQIRRHRGRHGRLPGKGRLPGALRENHLQIDLLHLHLRNSSPCGYAIGGIVGGSGIARCVSVNCAAVTGGNDVAAS